MCVCVCQSHVGKSNVAGTIDGYRVSNAIVRDGA